MIQWRLFGVLLVYVVLKGAGFPAFEVALDAFPVIFLSAIRFDIASILLLGYVFFSKTDWKPEHRGDIIAIVGGGVIAFAFSTATWSLGQKMTSSALSGLMTSLLPVLTAGFAWLILPDDRLSKRELLGLLIAFFGGLIILLPDGAVGTDARLVGKVLMFFGVASSAFGSVLIRWARPTLPTVSQTAWALFVAAGLLHLSSLFLGEPVSESTQTFESLFAILFMSVLVDSGGKIILFWLLQRTSPIKINLTAYVIPMIAGIMGMYLFSETLSSMMVGGFAIVLVGFGLIELKTLRREFLA